MVKRATRPVVGPAETRDRLDRMRGVAARFAGWRPAAQVLTRVRAVPTRFLQIDHAVRVGGWPLGRFATLHGPSNHGKTLLAHGLGLSFLERGHYFAFIDAEYTTPEDWLQKLMGEYAAHPGFVALRPRSFEETVDAVRGFADGIADARAKGEIDPDTTGVVVVDSMTKLTPSRLLAAIEKEGAAGKKGSVDGAGGRAAQYKAALTKAWLDELTPLLAHAGIAMVGITRESDDPDADARDRQFDAAWKVVGGKALIYDASLVGRVTRDSWLYEGEERRVVGERHRVRFWKTKVGGKDGRHADAYFHTSNGVLCPEGFDLARDLAELAIAAGVVEQAGAWYRFGDGAKWNGEARFLAALRGDPSLVREIESQVRALDEPREES